MVTDVAGPERESIFVSTHGRVRQILMLRDTSSLSHSGIVSSSEVNGNSEELPEGTVISVGVVSLYLFSYPASRCPVLCSLLSPSFNIPYCITLQSAHCVAHYIALSNIIFRKTPPRKG